MFDTPQPDAPGLDHDAALALLRLLKAVGYGFVTPTPATHRRVLKHPGKDRARDLRDILGWSLPFAAETAPPAVLAAMRAAGVVRETPDGLRSSVRVASLDGELFLHSAYPPREADAVFFGPDTYRFARWLRDVLADAPSGGRVVDVGAGSGAGAVVAAKLTRAAGVVVTDVNPRALAMARINLAAAGIPADFCRGKGLAGVRGEADLVIANPPFIADTKRAYRAGGDMLGARVSLDWTLEAAARLRPGGRFVLYTGSAIADGRDGLREAITARLDPSRHDLRYEEIDPDIFGEQLDEPAYQAVERIAAIGAVVTRRE